MIMLKCKTDLLSCKEKGISLTAIIDGDQDECVDELVAILDKIADDNPNFIAKVFKKMCENRNLT